MHLLTVITDSYQQRYCKVIEAVCNHAFESSSKVGILWKVRSGYSNVQWTEFFIWEQFSTVCRSLLGF